MKSARWFALGLLLMASLTWPAPGYSDPAISLQHLLTDKDCESVSELLGDWQAGSDLSGIWTIQRFGDRKYRLIQKVGESDSSSKEAFDICVAHLGGYLFFDATFQTVGPDGKTVLGDDDNFFWIPLHLIGRLDVVGDALHFRLLDDGWLQDALKSGRLHLTCSQDDEGGYLLTAPSKELKQFAARFAADLKVFSYPEDFDRVTRQEAIRRFRPLFFADGGSEGQDSEEACYIDININVPRSSAGDLHSRLFWSRKRCPPTTKRATWMCVFWSPTDGA